MLRRHLHAWEHVKTFRIAMAFAKDQVFMEGNVIHPALNNTNVAASDAFVYLNFHISVARFLPALNKIKVDEYNKTLFLFVCLL